MTLICFAPLYQIKLIMGIEQKVIGNIDKYGSFYDNVYLYS